MHHWQLTVRSEASATATVEDVLSSRLVPLLQSNPAASNVQLAACINCAGEYTVMADWQDAAELDALEGTGQYEEVLGILGPHLRVPPKRELWRLLL